MGKRLKPIENHTETRVPAIDRPSTTLEGRENQAIELAVNLAVEQLRAGTASSQVICHYLKLGTTREKTEQQLLKKQLELMDAKIRNLQDASNTAELYQKALEAMNRYSGRNDSNDEIY